MEHVRRLSTVEGEVALRQKIDCQPRTLQQCFPEELSCNILEGDCVPAADNCTKGVTGNTSTTFKEEKNSFIERRDADAFHSM